ncbi:MAG: response regulator [Thermodesulfovibrionales bacterium]|jgi:CheY-like chemotaxis protein|nr:response regulator [Thermodesulfovibrionales bacterium]
MDPEIEEYGEGFKTALICDDNAETQSAINSALKELNYKIDISTNSTDTLEKVRFNQYDVIVLNENFAGSSPENNEVLKFFQTMPMVSRRHVFLALIGQNLKTLDNMTAFSKSVNVVINKSDISNLTNILKKSIDDNDRFYKVYKETLRKLGKR